MHQPRHLPFERLSIMRFMFDHFIHIEIGNDTNIFYEKILVNDFSLRINEQTYTLSPEHLPEVGPLLQLFMQSVRHAHYANDVLVIEFANDAKIVVEPHPDYEAWNIFSASNESPEQLQIFARMRE